MKEDLSNIENESITWHPPLMLSGHALRQRNNRCAAELSQRVSDL